VTGVTVGDLVLIQERLQLAKDPHIALLADGFDCVRSPGRSPP
jgi:hypothetical protein